MFFLLIYDILKHWLILIKKIYPFILFLFFCLLSKTNFSIRLWEDFLHLLSIESSSRFSMTDTFKLKGYLLSPKMIYNLLYQWTSLVYKFIACILFLLDPILFFAAKIIFLTDHWYQTFIGYYLPINLMILTRALRKLESFIFGVFPFTKSSFSNN